MPSSEFATSEVKALGPRKWLRSEDMSLVHLEVVMKSMADQYPSAEKVRDFLLDHFKTRGSSQILRPGGGGGGAINKMKLTICE